MQNYFILLISLLLFGNGASTRVYQNITPPKSIQSQTTLSKSNPQFTLVDTKIRFVPAARIEEVFPSESDSAVVAWKTKYSDGEINFPDDGFWTMTTPKTDEHWTSKMKPLTGIPDNWKAPVNYYDGKIYYRVEVFEKPNDKTITSILCRITTEVFHGTHNIWLGHGVVAFREKGIYYFEQPVLAYRPFIRDSQFDFTKPLHTMQIAVTDLRGAIVHRRVEQGHNKFEGSPDLSLYLPLKIRYSVIVVAKGETLKKPGWW